MGIPFADWGAISRSPSADNLAFADSTNGLALSRPVGAENLIRPCEQDEWIEAMEWVNSILAMSGDVVAAQTHDPTLGRTR
jgi:hypothetical protein